MSNQIKIKIADVIGSNLGVSSEDGGAVYEKLKIALEADRAVELDFAGIDMLISAFLNAAIGKLVQSRNISEIKERIHFANIGAEDAEGLAVDEGGEPAAYQFLVVYYRNADHGRRAHFSSSR